MGHVILKEFHIQRQSAYFTEYVRENTDLPNLVLLKEQNGVYVQDRFLRASDFSGSLSQGNNPDWKTVAFDETSGNIVVPKGSIGFRWGETGQWNIEQKTTDGQIVHLRLSLIDKHDDVAVVGFPYFGGAEHPHFTCSTHDVVQRRNVPVKKITLADGGNLAATVFDLLVANYGIDRGLGGGNVAASYDDDVPYTPAWQEKITGVNRNQVIAVARAFAGMPRRPRASRWSSSARSEPLVSHGYELPGHHQSAGAVRLRRTIRRWLVALCRAGKATPANRLATLGVRPRLEASARQMNGTSFFYSHTSQWRYEKLSVNEILSPLADAAQSSGSLVDFNVRAERMGWLPSAPQLSANPLQVAKQAELAGKNPAEYVVEQLKSGALKFACEDPDNPQNFPRNLFVWRSNLLGSSGKGHEYFLKYLLGTNHGVQGKDSARRRHQTRAKSLGTKTPRKASWTC